MFRLNICRRDFYRPCNFAVYFLTVLSKGCMNVVSFHCWQPYSDCVIQEIHGQTFTNCWFLHKGFNNLCAESFKKQKVTFWLNNLPLCLSSNSITKRQSYDNSHSNMIFIESKMYARDFEYFIQIRYCIWIPYTLDWHPSICRIEISRCSFELWILSMFNVTKYLKLS